MVFDQDAPTWTYTDPWALQLWPDIKARLIYVGATAEEVDEFETQWLHDPEWPHEDKQRVAALGDGMMRAELVHVREVNRANLETADEARARTQQESVLAQSDAARQQALEMSVWEPEMIMRWVGRDRVRAGAQLAVEREHPRPRAALVAALESVLA